MAGGMFISKFVLNGNLLITNFRSYCNCSSSLHKEIFWMVQKNFKSISQHHGKVQIWLAFWNLCSEASANHQHFVASLVILVFAEPPHSFLSLNRLSSRSMNLCKWKREFTIWVDFYSYFYIINKGHYKMIMDMTPPEYNYHYQWCTTSFNHRPFRHKWFTIVTQKAFKTKYI